MTAYDASTCSGISPTVASTSCLVQDPARRLPTIIRIFIRVSLLVELVKRSTSREVTPIPPTGVEWDTRPRPGQSGSEPVSPVGAVLPSLASSFAPLKPVLASDATAVMVRIAMMTPSETSVGISSQP